MEKSNVNLDSAINSTPVRTLTSKWDISLATETSSPSQLPFLSQLNISPIKESSASCMSSPFIVSASPDIDGMAEVYDLARYVDEDAILDFNTTNEETILDFNTVELDEEDYNSQSSVHDFTFFGKYYDYPFFLICLLF
jgi:hypothetical protein